MKTEVLVAIFTIGGVVLTLLMSVMGGSFIAGKHSNRITNLEKRQADAEREAKEVRAEAAKANAQMAGFDATLKALGHTVHDGFEEVKTAIREMGQARSRRKVDEAG